MSLSMFLPLHSPLLKSLRSLLGQSGQANERCIFGARDRTAIEKSHRGGSCGCRMFELVTQWKLCSFPFST